MKYELWIGSKYLRAKRRQTAISVVTFLSVLGVGVGVMALIVVISVMTGFAANLMEKILGLHPTWSCCNAAKRWAIMWTCVTNCCRSLRWWVRAPSSSER